MAIRINLCIADLGNQSIALVESTSTGTSAITDYLDNPIKANTAKFVDVKPLATPATVFAVLDSGVVKSRTGSELLADIGGIGSVTPHNLLSATHSDTLLASPQNDDLIVGAGGTSSFKIIIPKENFPVGGLTNFPVLISEELGAGANKLSAISDFWSGIVDTTGGLDIRYYSDEAYSTELKCERVFLDIPSQKIEHWVQIPACSSSADYLIYVKVGGTNGSNDLTMWADANAVVVKHCQNNYLDSSGNGNNGNSNFDYGEGKIGRGFSAGTLGQHNILPSTPELQFVNNFCVSCWYQWAGDYHVNQTLIARYDTTIYDGHNDGLAFALKFSWACGFAIIGVNGEEIALNSMESPDGNYMYHWAMRYAGGTLYIYFNGILKNSVSISGDISSRVMPTGIGATSNGSETTTGPIDEVRIYDADHDIDWFATEYANQNSPETFASCETVIGGKGDSATWQRKAHGNDGDILNYSTADGVAWKSLADAGIESKLSGLTENTLPVADANNSIKNSIISQVSISTTPQVTITDPASSSGNVKVNIYAGLKNGTQSALQFQMKTSAGVANIPMIGALGSIGKGFLIDGKGANGDLSDPDVIVDGAGLTNLKRSCAITGGLSFANEQTATITGDTTINPTNSIIEITT